MRSCRFGLHSGGKQSVVRHPQSPGTGGCVLPGTIGSESPCLNRSDPPAALAVGGSPSPPPTKTEDRVSSLQDQPVNDQHCQHQHHNGHNRQVRTFAGITMSVWHHGLPSSQQSQSLPVSLRCPVQLRVMHPSIEELGVEVFLRSRGVRAVMMNPAPTGEFRAMALPGSPLAASHRSGSLGDLQYQAITSLPVPRCRTKETRRPHQQGSEFRSWSKTWRRKRTGCERRSRPRAG